MCHRLKSEGEIHASGRTLPGTVFLRWLSLFTHPRGGRRRRTATSAVARGASRSTKGSLGTVRRLSRSADKAQNVALGNRYGVVLRSLFTSIYT